MVYNIEKFSFWSQHNQFHTCNFRSTTLIFFSSRLTNIHRSNRLYNDIQFVLTVVLVKWAPFFNARGLLVWMTQVWSVVKWSENFNLLLSINILKILFSVWFTFTYKWENYIISVRIKRPISLLQCRLMLWSFCLSGVSWKENSRFAHTIINQIIKGAVSISDSGHFLLAEKLF